MKTPDFTIHIPEPCHEDWNAMQPDAKGKFCNSCNKSVHDFSDKTDMEIRTILMEYKDQKVCGRFKKTQIGRPLQISININDLPKDMSITKAFGIALFIVFGTMLFSCTDEKGQKVDTIEITNTSLAGTIDLMNPPPVENLPLERMMTGEPLMPIDTTLQTISFSETHVAGGISYHEATLVPESVIPVDSVPVEHYLGGLVAYEVIEPTDTSSVMPIDSTIPNDFKKLVELQQINKTKVFSVYPNPGTGEFTIRYDLLKRSDVKITVFNMNGSLVKSVANVTGQYEGQYHIPLNLNELPNGIYTVSLINNGTQNIERLVIAR